MSGRILVFDCFSGIAGDMTIASLVSAGASLDAVVAGLRRMPLPAFELRTETVTRGGIRALHLEVQLSEERTYQPDEMREMVRTAAFAPRVEQRALAAIDWLERGEAGAHETNRPHLHEAGGVDAVIDLVGSMLALEELDVAECWCPVVAVGAGTIARTSHGPIPAAPGPAAMHILREAGFAQRFAEVTHELVTPTGAAILTAVAKPGPATMTVIAHGAGAGTFDPANRPNALRVFIGEAASSVVPPELPRVVELAANIDDMTPELLANARDEMLKAGALDAWLEPIGMKKGRAATKLCVLVHPSDEERLAGAILRETTTLGVRATEWRRYVAGRRVETFASSLGDVRVKVRDWQGGLRGEPEFEDVRVVAERTGLPAVEVSRRVAAEWSRSTARL
ncbi:MAG: LarC family nickel insertion protein [Dehalococcoidia bacterium]|nr:LarC family nickel insertion protein [Dehalococcoidia bacterium]